MREKLAREAALLIYTSQEKEFKQAKVRAAKVLGVRMLPSNFEVAGELDRIAEEYEGELRKKRLVKKRKEALELMKTLRIFSPKLVGSVWRGTANRDSDTDIITFSSDQNLVIEQLKKTGFKITKSELVSRTKGSEKEEFFHIYLSLPDSDEAEIIIRSPERADHEERCEIYGDAVKGLSIGQLENVVSEDPLRRFLPIKA